MTALMHAARNKNLKIVKILIKAAANVNLKDKEMNTALTYTLDTDRIKWYHKEITEIVKLLIKAGADISVRSSPSGCTALELIYCLDFDHKLTEITELLEKLQNK